jgi:hypothetical protein
LGNADWSGDGQDQEGGGNSERESSATGHKSLRS